MSENKKEIKSKLLRQDEAEKPLPFVPEYIFAADPSMRNSGFALIQLLENGRMKLIATNVCDNSRRKGTHGLLLTAIASGVKAMASRIPPDAKVTFVRERVFSRFPNETQALSKVAGVLDYILTKDILGSPKREWQIKPDHWEEIAPKSIKAIIAGSGSATKDDVQKSLFYFVGAQTYKTDHESDATAVGVAYCMMNELGKRMHMPGETDTIHATSYIPPKVRNGAGAVGRKPKKNTAEKEAIG